jgi:hypothetical protein
MLADLLDDFARHWYMIWLYGSAGCGKSAVAQTFAEYCVEAGRLGAAYFFSRPNKRNNPNTVIPTIAYQLAVCCAEYKSILGDRLADDPQLLSKALPVQFKLLIVEPFTYLKQSIRKPFVIVLDGLDECQGQDAQCEFVKLINELVRMKRDLSLLWLICSRPEAHLKLTFARITDCGREELEIDQECRNDVDRYLRDGLYDLGVKYSLSAPWPPQAQFDIVSKSGSGHFAFAATALGFVADEGYADPVGRLNLLVAFLERIARGPTNPLAKLDFLYCYILQDIPEHIFPTTWRILAHFIFAHQIFLDDEHDILIMGFTETGFLFRSAQELCNFLDLEQHTFYTALHRLHSVVDVPPPGKAVTTPLRFYHASFQDFLVDPGRSKGFVIDKQKAFVDIFTSLSFWHQV